MAILDDLKDMAKSARDSAEDLIETTRLNNRVNDEQRRIARYKTQLGEYVWQQYAAGYDDFPEGVLDICRNIDEANMRMAKLTAEINSIKSPNGPQHTVACIGCGAQLREDDRFCPKCGAEQVQAETQSEKRVCPVCNEKLDGNAAFCTKCGAPAQ